MSSTAHPTDRSAETDQATMDGVLRAAGAAAPALAMIEPAGRADLLVAAADALDAAVDRLVEAADAETGLGTTRLSGEVGRTTGQLRLFASVLHDGAWLEATIDHADADLGRPDVRRQLEPLGPGAVFAASNFPFAFSVAGGDTASALAAGCPVVVKAHPGHPETSAVTAEVLDDALTRAGAPRGTFAMVSGVERGRDLVAHPAIRAVGFTGSVAGGRALFDLAVSRPDPIPFYGELGSLNPVVVTSGAAAARPEEIATGLVGSFTLGVGQFCTKPGVVLVPRGAGLEDAVAAAAAEAAGGRMLTGRIAEGFRDRLGALVDLDGVDVLTGPADQAGAAATPVVLVTDAARLVAEDLLAEECFGPVVVLVRYGEDELADTVAALPSSLTATLHLADDEVEDAGELLAALRDRAGRVIVNGWPTGVAVTWAMHHGGGWPATTNPLHTSVGTTAIRRFLRPVCYQDVPAALLPPALRDDNPLGIPRRVDGRLVL